MWIMCLFFSDRKAIRHKDKFKLQCSVYLIVFVTGAGNWPDVQADSGHSEHIERWWWKWDSAGPLCPL